MTGLLYTLSITCMVAAAFIATIPHADNIAIVFILAGLIIGWGAIRQHHDR